MVEGYAVIIVLWTALVLTWVWLSANIYIGNKNYRILEREAKVGAKYAQVSSDALIKLLRRVEKLEALARTRGITDVIQN